MAKEMSALKAIFENPRRPSVFILGGAKFGDVSEMIDHVLGNGTADTVILVGLAGNAYLLARGVDIGNASAAVLRDERDERPRHVREHPYLAGLHRRVERSLPARRLARELRTLPARLV